MNTFFRCLESRIDKNNTLYGKFSLDSIPSGQGNTFANSLRRSLLSDLSGLAITHFCIMSKPGLNYEFATLPGLTESLLDFSLNLKKVVLSGRVIEPFLDETSSFSAENVLHSQILSGLTPSGYGAQIYNPPVVPKMVESKIQMGVVPSPSHTCHTPEVLASSSATPHPKGVVSATKGIAVGDVRVTPHPLGVVTERASSMQDLKVNSDGDEAMYNHISCLPQKGTSQFPFLKSDLFNSSQVRNLSLAPIGFLKVKGPAILRASDLVLPPGVRCVHPNQYLGTLAIDGVLSIKFLIAAGKGFIVQDEVIYNSLSRARLLASSDMLFKQKVKFNNTSMSYVPSPSPSQPYVPYTEGVSRGNEGVRVVDLRSNAVAEGVGNTSPLAITQGCEGVVMAVPLWGKDNKGISASCRAAKVRLEALPKVMVSSSNIHRVAVAEGVGKHSKGSGSSIRKNDTRGVSISSPSYTLHPKGVLVAPSPKVLGHVSIAKKMYADLLTPKVYPNQRDTIGVTKGNMCRSRLKQQNGGIYYIQNTRGSLPYVPSPKAIILRGSSPSHTPKGYVMAMIQPSPRAMGVLGVSRGNEKVPPFAHTPLPKVLASPKVAAMIQPKYIGLSDSQKNVLSINKKVYGMSFASLPFCFATQLTPFPMWYKLCQVIPCLPFFTSCFYRKKKVFNLLKSVKKLSPSNIQRIESVGTLSGVSLEFSLNDLSQNYTNLGRLASFNKNKSHVLRRRGMPLPQKDSAIIDIRGYKGVAVTYVPTQTPKGVKVLPTPSATAITEGVGRGNEGVRDGNGELLTPSATSKKMQSSAVLIKSNEDYLESKKRYENTFSYKSFVNTVNNNKKLSKKQLIWGGDDNSYPVLPLDVTFTPVSKVNFQININRNAEKNQETIIFEIWTNGSITPKRALQESSLALAQDFYNLFCNVNEFSNLQSWWKRESIESRTTCAPALPNGLSYSFGVSSSVTQGMSTTRLTPLQSKITFPLVKKVVSHASCHARGNRRSSPYVPSPKAITFTPEGVLGVSRGNEKAPPFAYTPKGYHALPSLKSLASRRLWRSPEGVNVLPSPKALETTMIQPKCYIQVGAIPSVSSTIISDMLFKKSPRSTLMTAISKVTSDPLTLSTALPRTQQVFFAVDRKVVSPRDNTKSDETLPALGVGDGNHFLQKNLDFKTMHTQIKSFTKVKLSENKNVKLKQKIQYLHTFWRLNISDLNLSLKTQLLLKKLNINNVYDLHFFILKKSWSLFLNRQQQDEIIKIYLNFGLNSPF